MDKYPQCYDCTLSQNGICKRDGKPIKRDAQIFGACRYYKPGKSNQSSRDKTAD